MTYKIVLAPYIMIIATREAMAREKPVLTEGVANPDYLIISVIILLLTLILFLAGRKILLHSGFKALPEAEQVEKLVKSFYKMARTIETRDRSLKMDKEMAEKANRDKDDFLLNISHELRTPMHAILNFAEIGKNKANKQDAENIALYFDRIEESGERLLGLINRILDLTKLESGHIKFNIIKNDINKCIEQSLNNLHSLVEVKHLHVTTESQADITEVKFDYAYISQVLVNLLANAIKFTPEGKSIIVTVNKGNLTTKENKEINAVCVSVSNEGNKIPKGELEAVFGKFVQGSSLAPGMGGSGIGLAICREIINLHHGSIWAENLDSGVKFTFAIPALNQSKEVKNENTGS